MELVRTLLVVFLVVVIALSLFRIMDYFSSWYDNEKPRLANMSESIANNTYNGLGIQASINASDYSLWDKVKPYFQPLDITLVLAFIAAFVGVFIYSKERT